MGNSRKRSIRLVLLLTAAAIGPAAVWIAPPAAAQAPGRDVDFDIPEQALASALSEYARQTRQQLLYSPDLVENKRSAAVKGRMSAEAALRRILRGSGLSYRSTPSGAFLLAAQLSGAMTNAEVQSASSLGEAGNEENAGPSRSDGDIIVTAQKREQRLQDVPVPVSVISGQSLVETGQTGLQDFYNKVPGVSLTSFLGGTPVIVIRGVTSGGFNNPTVGIMIDDAPYGASTSAGGGYQALDLDPSDLERIEVLRGPQGTLFGASSMGGLVQYVTLNPSVNEVSGRFQAGVEDVRNGQGLGYNIRGSLNLPLADTFAVRASIFSRHDAGYVDDPVHRLRGLNRGDSYGGRISALWRPSDTIRLKLSAAHQHNKVLGSNEVANDAVYRPDDLQQPSYIPNAGGSNNRTTSFSGNLGADLGFGDLTLVSAYSHNRLQLNSVIPSLSASANTAFGVTDVTYFSPIDLKKFSQEARIDIPLGDNVDWLLGGFYTNENSNVTENIFAANATTGDRVGVLQSAYRHVIYNEYASFTNVTVKLGEKFDVQLGARQSWIKVRRNGTVVGSLVGAPQTQPLRSASADAFTYLLTPRFKPNEDMMIYVRVASGYRAGGPSANVQNPAVPPTFEPDRTVNYEFGIKGSLFDRAIDYELSAYYIDWKNIQIRQVLATFGYVANAGQAKSEGVEASITARPFAGMTISGWGAYNNAVLKEGFPPQSTNAGRAGDRLPYSAKYSANFGIVQEVPVNNRWTASLGGDINYVGPRLNDFSPTAVRARLPAYTKLDLRTAVKSDQWTVGLFVNNVFDKQGQISIGSTTPTSVAIIQPRTIGLNVTHNF